jgi:hypothetical protein
VLLPWAPRGQTRSGLNRPCAAVCSWLAEVAEADIQEIGGIVSGEPLLAIIQKVNALKDQPESG